MRVKISNAFQHSISPENFGSKFKRKNDSLWYNLFQVFLHWRHWQRIAYRSYRSLRIANWIGSYQIVPGHTRSNRIVVFWIFWGIKSYLTFLQFSIFEGTNQNDQPETLKNVKVIKHKDIDLLFGRCNNSAVHCYMGVHCNMHLVRRVLVDHLNEKVKQSPTVSSMVWMSVLGNHRPWPDMAFNLPEAILGSSRSDPLDFAFGGGSLILLK